MASIEAEMFRRDLRQLFDGRGVVGLTEAQLVDSSPAATSWPSRRSRRSSCVTARPCSPAAAACWATRRPPRTRSRRRSSSCIAAPGRSGSPSRSPPGCCTWPAWRR